jgi:hypothetical protein
METGMLAADALLQAGDDAAVQAGHAQAMRALKPQFDLYEMASRINHHPWLADLVVWRAQRSARIMRRLVGVLEETQNPGRLFTFSGITKLMFE